jgi:hypothetical protein
MAAAVSIRDITPSENLRNTQQTETGRDGETERQMGNDRDCLTQPSAEPVPRQPPLQPLVGLPTQFVPMVLSAHWDAEACVGGVATVPTSTPFTLTAKLRPVSEADTATLRPIE